MVFIAAIVILGVVAYAAVHFGMKVGNDVGSGLGNKYMKEEWGLDEKEEYHE